METSKGESGYVGGDTGGDRVKETGRNREMEKQETNPSTNGTKSQK